MSEGPYTYPYPAHYVTTDIIVFTYRDETLHVALIRRGLEPFKDCWALPGGFLRPNEELEACARRELAEETALEHFLLEQLAAVGTLGRDPRGRVITVAYLALGRWVPDVKAGNDAAEARWHRLDRLPRLAFDHGVLIKMARARLEEILKASPLSLLKFLPEEYTTAQMQKLHEAVLGASAERRAFYRAPN